MPDEHRRLDGAFHGHPRAVRDRLVKSAQIRSYLRGHQVFGPRNVPESLLFLFDGTIRVPQASENGREIVLYRIELLERASLRQRAACD